MAGSLSSHMFNFLRKCQSRLWHGSHQGVLHRNSAASVLVLTVRQRHPATLQETLQH